MLKAKLAIAALIGVFLIPIGQSSLRGITHILTCSEQVEAPFQVIIEEGEAIVTGASRLAPEDPATLCGGLTAELSVRVVEGGRISVNVPISNQTAADWYGTVQLEVAGTRVPVDLGRIDASTTVERQIILRLPEGTVEFDGVLLVGP